ncbi:MULTISPECIES: hypothetical protein [Saccharopolyspora]|uniref:Uncharacterized protein n=1 Tax=Saccharopolyspora cebuensis TaxID=418759 RepID=A0ABV4CR14_9PSEU
MNAKDEEPVLDVARGDAALSQHLRNSLRLLRGKVDDPHFRSMVDDVLAGEKGLRDTLTSPQFAAALDPLVQRGAEEYSKLSEAEREELARTGEEQFEAMRRPDPPADGRARPAEEEDEDFSDEDWLR